VLGGDCLQPDETDAIQGDPGAGVSRLFLAQNGPRQ
jgi:hypothetical protein